MANEFIIKNGFQAKGNSEITGSLNVSGSITSTGLLNIQTIGTGSSVIPLGLDASGNVVTGSAATGAGIFGISDSSGTYTYYTTLTLAMAAAVSGDTIEMFADVEETGSVTITLKDGVKINGNGHTYTLSVNDTTNAFTVNTVGTFETYNLKVLRTGRATGTTNGYTFYSTQTNAKIYFFGVHLYNDFGTCFYGGGKIRNAYGIGYLYGLNGGLSSYPEVHDSYFESTSSGYGMFVPYTNIYNSVGISNSSYGIYCNGNVYGSRGISVSGVGLYAQRMSDSVGISSTNYGCQGGGYNCIGLSVSGIGGAGTFYQSTLRSTSNYASTGDLYNCTSISTSSITILGGSIYNSNLQCLWNNTGGHCMTSLSLGSRNIVNCVLSVANASAYCINGYGGSTWNYTNNTFIGATTPVNPTIIQGITNTSDSQGNILI